MAYDITQVAAVETSVVELVDGKDEPLNDSEGKRLSVTVYGPGSKQYARAQARKNNAIVARLKKKGKSEASAEENAAETAEFLAACTVSFNGWEYPDAAQRGDVEHFKAAYADPKLGYIRDQVNEHINDWANFTTSSAKS